MPLYREIGIFAAREPVLKVVDRIEQLDPHWIRPCTGEAYPKLCCQAIRRPYETEHLPMKESYSGGYYPDECHGKIINTGERNASSILSD